MTRDRVLETDGDRRRGLPCAASLWFDAPVMGSRWWSLVVFVSLAACQFDPGGTGLGGDDTAALDAAATGIDGPVSAIDASSSPDAVDTPAPVTCGGAICAPGTICCVGFDSTMTCATEPDCQGTSLACDAPSDCPGEDCCLYGGVASTCSPTCFGGDQVCDAPADCGPIAGQCCPSDLGPKVCRVVCF